MSSVFGADWMKVNGRPTMKSTRPMPVTPPSKVYVPGDRTLASDSESQKATCAPNPNWWLPRIIVRSSPNVKVFVVKIAFVLRAAAQIEAAGHVEEHVLVQVAVAVDADVARTEEVGVCVR